MVEKSFKTQIQTSRIKRLHFKSSRIKIFFAQSNINLLSQTFNF